ncbi:MAG: aconitate hydratase AcnA [Deltaproteobacteria bacterium]|nr:aconitate hydratase AcnA [Deltaproteobacteria bacterium]
MAKHDPFKALATFESGGKRYAHYRLAALSEAGLGDVATLPCSIRVLLESVLRNCDDFIYTQDHVRALAAYEPAGTRSDKEIPFMPGRVVLQDFTGVPTIVDLAALRSAVARLGGDVSKVNPLVRADLVIDHSVQVDAYGTADAIGKNTALEFERNRERYEFLKWGQNAFANFSVVPPETGIVHQVNLEHLAGVVLERAGDGDEPPVIYPDSCYGTDSHTTMVNGLGVLGWGVGGIEAEAAMLGQPSYRLIPEVVGFELTGRLKEGVTATDLVLLVTQMLRKHGVVEKFVEFFGSGLDELTLADRATIANMAPEYGATCGFFPIDDKTLDYLALTGRSAEHIALVRDYAKASGFWRDDAVKARFGATLRLDLGDVQPALAGPSRPQDRILLADMKGTWGLHLKETFKHPEPRATAGVEYKGQTFELKDGAVVIAAITSCTNTSNPAVLIGAGLLARKARARGLDVKPWVKTSLAPGSRVVTDYLEASGLQADLDALGFFTVGYGCTTCIGNSGPLSDPMIAAITQGDLVATSVLSGNRNFEGRISPQVKANYLASPPLCVAYAIAGTVDWDPYKEALGVDRDGRPVMLADIWPSNAEIERVMHETVTTEQFRARYADVFAGGERWRALPAPTGALFSWDAASTYIQEPPYFVDLAPEPPPIAPVRGAHALALLGHSITTDHISPAGNIAKDSPAAKYLVAHGVGRADWNSYGSRRGNDRVMTRGTFANIRIKNALAPGKEGGYTTYLGPDEDVKKPDHLTYDSDVKPRRGEVTTIYDASVKYQAHGIPLVVLAGKDYGMGSSRDWAAKGTFLLGVRAVIAESYERIHRANLVGMGVLPLQFLPGESAASLGLTGHERFDVDVDDGLQPLQDVTVRATGADGATKSFTVRARVDTPVEVTYLRNGGVLHTVLRRLAK